VLVSLLILSWLPPMLFLISVWLVLMFLIAFWLAFVSNYIAFNRSIINCSARSIFAPFDHVTS
jgi:hypothetical protein